MSDAYLANAGLIAEDSATESVPAADATPGSGSGVTLATWSGASAGQLWGEMTASDTGLARGLFVVFVCVALYLCIYLSFFLVSLFQVGRSAPYMVSGVLPGSTPVTIVQNPNSNPTQFIARSDDDAAGLAFTYSFWLQLDAQTVPTGAGGAANLYYFPVFVKGRVDATHPSTDHRQRAYTHGPGVYVVYDYRSSATGQASLQVVMDTEDDGAAAEVVSIQNLPMRKWVHLAVRAQNSAVDIYVNGTAAARRVLPALPHQNYENLYVCPAPGFAGSLADLRYYPYTLSVFALQALVLSGPNTSPSIYASSASTRSQYHYLASDWYGGQ